jgi:hypothetical protein
MQRDRLVQWGPPTTAVAAMLLFVAVAPAASTGDQPAPGVPLWAVIERAASLLPLGDQAWRLRMVSAVAGALAVWWTARLVTSIARDVASEPDAASAWGGISAGALLACAYVFLRDATAVGVAAVVVAALAGTALLIDRAAREGATAASQLAIACGLGLGLGVGYLWIAPVAIVVIVVRRRRGARFPLAVLAVAGCAMLALLPLSHAAPDARAPGLHALGDDLVDSLGPVGVVAAVWGAFALWRRRRLWPAVALTTVAAADLAWTLTRGGDGVALVWAATAAAGLGAAALVRLTGRFAPAAGAGVTLLCVLPAALLSVPLA